MQNRPRAVQAFFRRSVIRRRMPFTETRVRVQHPCPYCDLSVAFPDVELDLWTSTRSDVFLITAPTPSRLRDMVRAMRQILSARALAFDGSSALVVTHKARWDFPPSVTGLADRRGVWLVPPTLYLGGWETYRAIAPTQAALRAFVVDVKKVGAVEVLSHRARDQLEGIRSLGTVPVHLLDGVTQRQLHVLVTAIERGLFELPVKEKMDRVAMREGLSRSTFGEHLRKAEMQILQNAYPFLKLQDRTAISAASPVLGRPRGAGGESPVGNPAEPGRE